MLKIVLAVVLLAAGSAGACAKTFKIAGDDPTASIAIPDSWETQVDDDGIEAVSPDKGIDLTVEIVAAEDLKRMGEETAKSLAEQKITLKPETKKEMPITIAGMPGVGITWDASDEDGPTQVHLVVVKIDDDQAILLTRRGTAAAETTSAADLDAIVKSIAPIK